MTGMNDFVELGNRPSSPQIAIVGAGPSGLFAAQSLRRLLAHAAIDVFDRLPVPFGLIRYGVAPDHQGIKATARQFERLFERENVQFLGNVQVGRDLSIEELKDLYDVVVLAAGLAGDRRLGIPGETLPGVFTAGALTRWLNAHPDEAGLLPRLGSHVLIIGNGNVALDVARLLLKTPEELCGSDLHPDCVAHLKSENVREVEIIGRGAPGNARFDPAMVKQLAALETVHISVACQEAPDADANPCVAALRAIDGHGNPESPRKLRFRFSLSPVSIAGKSHVSGACFAIGDRVETIDATSVVTAIGFAPDENVPVGLTRGACSEVVGHDLARVYTAGWFGRGPRGTIAENRLDARAVAETIAAQFADGQIRPEGRRGRDGALTLLHDRAVRPVDYHGWLRIRAAEDAARTDDLARLKISDWKALLALAQSPHLVDVQT
jgi:ferredoxin/flavodoxin---NADP+ reductase